MKVFKHFCTITKHRHKVMACCFKVGIGFQGLFHDLSKYSPAEFIPGVKYYQGNRSPNESERENLGYSKAWMHHKGRNKHHFEYWCDYDPNTKKMTPVKMPLNYVAEMFCDRVAAGKIYKGKDYTDNNPIDYFLKGKETRSINRETSDLLESWLLMLKEKGEKETFTYIKNFLKNNKDY